MGKVSKKYNEYHMTYVLLNKQFNAASTRFPNVLDEMKMSDTEWTDRHVYLLGHAKICQNVYAVLAADKLTVAEKLARAEKKAGEIATGAIRHAVKAEREASIGVSKFAAITEPNALFALSNVPGITLTPEQTMILNAWKTNSAEGKKAVKVKANIA